MRLLHLIPSVPQTCTGVRRTLRTGALLAACASLLLTAGAALAQDAPGAADNSASIAPVSGVSDVLPAQKLGANDLVQFMIPYCPELSRSFRIGSDGTLALPLLKQPIHAAGLMPEELGKQVAAALVKDQILVDPVVNVSVLEYRSRPINVVGAVNHPIDFQASGPVNLLDAIARAGGLSATAGPTITVTHRQPGADGSMQINVESIPVKGLIDQADPKLNIALTGNDEVRVPEAGHIFVAGNVHKPGSYPMQNNSDTTVVKALALSEGLDAYSAKDAYIYRETTPGSPREEITVPLSKILARKAPDVMMHNDDILYVPENNGKRMTAKVLSQLAGFGSTTAAGVLIYR